MKWHQKWHTAHANERIDWRLPAECNLVSNHSKHPQTLQLDGPHENVAFLYLFTVHKRKPNWVLNRLEHDGILPADSRFQVLLNCSWNDPFCLDITKEFSTSSQKNKRPGLHYLHTKTKYEKMERLTQHALQVKTEWIWCDMLGMKRTNEQMNEWTNECKVDLVGYL